MLQLFLEFFCNWGGLCVTTGRPILLAYCFYEIVQGKLPVHLQDGHINHMNLGRVRRLRSFMVLSIPSISGSALLQALMKLST